MKANTDLGQHFMVDKELLSHILFYANIQPNEIVLEIGPGFGVLTTLIEEQTTQLITVDVDERFKATHYGNILELIEMLSFDSVVSNLPYHICEPLFIKFITLQPKKITVVVGDKFAQHLQGKTILGSIFQSVYDISYIETIAPESFNPPPKVVSALIQCSLKVSVNKISDFYQYSKSKVKNYLKTKITKRKAQEFINKLPELLVEKRLYELSKEEFLKLNKIIQTM